MNNKLLTSVLCKWLHSVSPYTLRMLACSEWVVVTLRSIKFYWIWGISLWTLSFCVAVVVVFMDAVFVFIMIIHRHAYKNKAILNIYEQFFIFSFARLLLLLILSRFMMNAAIEERHCLRCLCRALNKKILVINAKRVFSNKRFSRYVENIWTVGRSIVWKQYTENFKRI